MITTLLPTIGRSFLKNSVASALREGFKVIVIGDGINVKLPDFPQVTVTRTGKKYGHYGFICCNLGAYMADTDFINVLGDDDEIIEGTGDWVRQRMAAEPDVDIWIPGLLLNNGKCVGVTPGVFDDNYRLRLDSFIICSPFMRTSIFARAPFYTPVESEWKNIHEGLDFHWVSEAITKNHYKVKWFEEPIVRCRPSVPGVRGYGSNDLLKMV